MSLLVGVSAWLGGFLAGFCFRGLIRLMAERERWNR